jgi:DNA (cytosine-5)-methyltransferase 1
MSGSMRFGSVCSGIEAASVAWHPLGWKAAWLSEIEKFPCVVLAHHYPDVPNLGDMTTLPNPIRLGEVEAPDVFCGGTPCQAFSVAGLRKSLDDARGNLSLTFCEIADAIDQVRLIQQSNPSIVFWENVPGVLNTKDNAFGCFLGALAGEDDALVPPGGRWSNAGFIDGPQRAVAWRVLDAQYFGVAQRRRRVFVVASARDDFDPAAVLFEFEGLRRDIAPRRETGKGVAVSTEASVASGKPTLGTLMANAGTKLWLGNQEALTGDYHILQPTYAIPGNWIGRKPENGGNATEPMYDIAPCLTKADQHGVAQPIPIDMRNAGRDPEKHDEMNRQGVGVGNAGDSAHTVTSAFVHGVANGMAVRRLTPVECERLQGFPDNYTKIADKTPDGSRYKALGNSWAVPVVRWIGERIARAIP